MSTIGRVGGPRRASASHTTTREVARRIVVNLSYAAAVRELRGPSPKVSRLKSFKGPLPGIYADGRRRGTSA